MGGKIVSAKSQPWLYKASSGPIAPPARRAVTLRPPALDDRRALRGSRGAERGTPVNELGCPHHRRPGGIRACPAGNGKGTCACSLTRFPTSGFGRARRETSGTRCAEAEHCPARSGRHTMTASTHNAGLSASPRGARTPHTTRSTTMILRTHLLALGAALTLPACTHPGDVSRRRPRCLTRTPSSRSSTRPPASPSRSATAATRAVSELSEALRIHTGGVF